MECGCQVQGYRDERCGEHGMCGTEARFVFCPVCDGSGVEVFGITVYEPGCGYSHPSTDERPCRTCDGSGTAEIEVEPITLEDLEVAP